MFTVQAFYNPHLPPGGERLDAVLTVACDATDGAPAAGGRAASKRFVAIVLDCSGSMFGDGKIEAAKHAARRAIAALPPNTLFTVIAFGDDAHKVVNTGPATTANKGLADRVVQNLGNAGGTRMSRALAAVRAEVNALPGAIAWTYFLTDGANQGEKSSMLAHEIEACKGLFQCDCRGIGVDWEPGELRHISNALLGTADAVPDPENLDADLNASLRAALSKGVSGVSLDLWKPATAKLVSLRQMQPDNVDVTTLGKPKSERVTSFDIGSWGKETRDYHAVFEVQDGEIGDEMLVCRPSVVWNGDGAEQKSPPCPPIVATWSEDAELTTRINPEVAHYTGQAEIASSIREGLAARDRGNAEEATRLLGRAAQLAQQSGNEEVTRRLSKVVDVVDAELGTVRLKKNVSKGEELELEMGGTRTVRRGAT
jgi:hypothetical protein